MSILGMLEDDVDWWIWLNLVVEVERFSLWFFCSDLEWR